MQVYNPLLPTGLISEDRQTINDNMECIITDFAGTAFPTNNLFEGMLCARKDQKKVYRLEADLATWKQFYDYSTSEITVPKANKAVLDVDGNPIKTTYLKSVPIFQGATSDVAGEAGQVPAPEINEKEKFLKGDGSWSEVPKLTKADLLDMIYPVGSIYMSVNSSNPGSLFGGTWEKMPAGRVLIPEGESDWGTTYTAGSQGGEATHTLTVDEMPSHKHSTSMNSASLTGRFRSRSNMYYNTNNGPSSTLGTATTSGMVSVVESKLRSEGNADANKTEYIAQINASHTHTLTASNTGSGKAHNIIQPYYTCYIWKRVS